MKNKPVNVRKTLKTLIQDMGKSAWLYAKDAQRDFTRNRKLPFEKLLTLLISMGGGTLTKELLDYFKYAPETASSSAFIQQREKLVPEALDVLFHTFTDACGPKRLYQGYRLLAADGSNLQIPTDSSHMESYFPGSQTQQGYNLLHMDAFYDLCDHLYVDALVHGSRAYGEKTALVKMVDRSPIAGPVILMADRGYEAFNCFAHMERKGWNYLVRIKDFDSNGIASSIPLPKEPQFDLNVDYILTRKHTNKLKALIRENPAQYRLLSQSQTFDFLDLHENLFYPLAFRLVRFQVAEGCFEVVATNLPPDRFPLVELKKLYHLRWGIETAFRHLKYSLGLLNFHSKKTEHIVQELFAKLIMYNFTELITSHVIIHAKSRKYAYQANFSAAVHICRQFFRCAVAPPFVYALISKLLEPIRPGRSYPRYCSNSVQMRFVYRIT